MPDSWSRGGGEASPPENSKGTCGRSRETSHRAMRTEVSFREGPALRECSPPLSRGRRTLRSGFHFRRRGVRELRAVRHPRQGRGPQSRVQPLEARRVHRSRRRRCSRAPVFGASRPSGGISEGAPSRPPPKRPRRRCSASIARDLLLQLPGQSGPYLLDKSEFVGRRLLYVLDRPVSSGVERPRPHPPHALEGGQFYQLLADAALDPPPQDVYLRVQPRLLEELGQLPEAVDEPVGVVDGPVQVARLNPQPRKDLFLPHLIDPRVQCHDRAHILKSLVVLRIRLRVRLEDHLTGVLLQEGDCLVEVSVPEREPGFEVGTPGYHVQETHGVLLPRLHRALVGERRAYRLGWVLRVVLEELRGRLGRWRDDHCLPVLVVLRPPSPSSHLPVLENGDLRAAALLDVEPREVRDDDPSRGDVYTARQSRGTREKLNRPQSVVVLDYSSVLALQPRMMKCGPLRHQVCEEVAEARLLPRASYPPRGLAAKLPLPLGQVPWGDLPRLRREADRPPPCSCKDERLTSRLHCVDSDVYRCAVS